jgi:hypothetical protein
VSNPPEDRSDAGWREKIDRVSTWRAELTEEAIALPSTLRDLRQTISDLRQVSARLEGVTKGMEVLLSTAESSGLGALARHIDVAASEVEKQVSAVQSVLPGPNLVPVEELRKTVEAFTSLIPKPRKGDRPKDS